MDDRPSAKIRTRPRRRRRLPWMRLPARPQGAEPAQGAEADKAAKDALDNARKSVEDAASVSGVLWLSYLFTLFYIGIAAGGVTHKDLLLENPVKLPFLNVELPLVAFFSLAPIIFIIVHAYTLVHFVMLAAKAGAYDRAVRAAFGEDAEKAGARSVERRRLPSNIFVQFLAGPHDIREGGLGFLLKTIAWVSLVIGPVLLLLLIQAQFLPYHLEWVTWAQRIAVFADVVLLWALWPAVVEGRSTIEWPRLWRHRILTLASLIPIGIAFTAATFPGEWLDEAIGNKQWIPANPLTQRLGIKQTDDRGKPRSTSLHDLLFAGEIDKISGRRKSLFSNSLILTGLDLLDDNKIDDGKKFEWAKHSFSLRGRHLEEAVFDFSDLRKVDLTGAHLQRASFVRANLQLATLNAAELQGALLNAAQLQGALLRCDMITPKFEQCAQLQRVILDRAKLQGAALDHAQLQGASLAGAQLQGANLDESQLEKADLRCFDPPRGPKECTDLRGASLNKATLREANLRGAQFQSASLRAANLQNAVFEDAALEATDESMAILSNTNFRGASVAFLLKEGGNSHPISKETNDILQNASVSRNDYQKILAEQLKELVCSADSSAIYIVRGLIWLLFRSDVLYKLVKFSRLSRAVSDHIAS